MPEQTLQLVPAANGETTAIFLRKCGRELYLHSRFNPSKEARMFVTKIPIHENTLYVVLGSGFGYHIKELLNKIPHNSHIVVVEPNTVFLGSAVQQHYQQLGKNWIHDRRLTFLNLDNPDIVSYHLAEMFVKYHLFNLEMATHIPSAMTDETFYKSVTEIIPHEFAGRLNDTLMTLDRTLENNLINFWGNLESTWSNPSITGFADQWKGKPSIIVSAGPSLTAQLDTLRKIQGKVLMICVGAAAKVLIHNGISPDFVISVDPNETCMAQFNGWNSEQIALLYYHQTWREIPASHNGLKFWFTLQNDSPIPARENAHTHSFFGGGTVAFSALQFARYVKSDPIIFVGQDFAFLNGFTHAIGTDYNLPFNEDILPNGFFKVPGTNGNMVITNQIYHSYLTFMQEYITKKQDTHYINTSQSGARIAGTQEMPLEEAIDLYCGSPINITEKIKLIWNECEYKGKENTASLLDSWHKELYHFIMVTKEIWDLKKLIATFKTLQIYKLNSVHFDAIFYTAAMNEKWFGIPLLDTVKRLKTHIEIVLQKISQMQEKL